MRNTRLSLSRNGLMIIEIADGLSKLGHVHGGFQDGLSLYSPEFQAGETKIIGRAFTVKFASKSDTSAPKLNTNYVS